MNDITLQQIEIFIAVSEQLSLSEAARDLFINQSAVSRWIQRLETSLNTKLFERNNRGVELTENGEFLYTELKPLMERLNVTLQNMRNMYNMPSNSIRVGCLDSTEIISSLKDVIEPFGEQYPDTLLNIKLFNFKDIREELVCGKLDCIVVYSMGFGEYWNIATKKFKQFNTFLCLPLKHHLSKSKEIPAQGLSGEALYLLSVAEMKNAEKRAIEICRSLGFLPREIKYMPSSFAIELAMKNGMGFTFCSANTFKCFNSEMKFYPVETPFDKQYAILAWRETGCTPLTRSLIDSVPEAP